MLNVKPTVYTALSTDTALVALVTGGIFADRNPDGGTYPAITYSEISNVPALNADDTEDMSRVTIQISVMTDSGSTSAIAERVDEIMTLALGFNRQFSGDIMDGNIKIKAMRYTTIG